MSLKLIASEIARFLASKEPEIVCIKGRWGVGKTYAWRHFLKEAQLEQRIGYSKYSYISLFGRNSLADLRSSVIENTVETTDVGAKPSITSLEAATTFYRRFINKAGVFAGLIPQTNGYSQLAQRLLFLFTRDTIVCLDDLERAGSGLSLKDVLGLASQLKDEKGCKVVILLNDEKLNDTAKSDFQEQLEKVVDIVIDFEINSEEAVDVALNTGTIFYEKLKENCIKLKLDNIRVIKKAEMVCYKLASLLANFDDRLLHQAVHTATLACYAKYQPDKAPSYAAIRKFNPWEATIKSLDGSKSEVDPQYLFMREYGLSSIDGFDEAILDAVNRGYFDEGLLKIEAKQIDENLRSSDMKEDYHRAWKMYRSSFTRNEDEFADIMVQSVKRNIGVIDPLNLDSVVRVLRDIDFDDRATDLIEYFIANKKEDSPSYWDLSTFEYRGRIRDASVAQAITNKYQSTKRIISPLEHLRNVGETDSWNDNGISAIIELTEEELYEILVSSEDDELNIIIAALTTLLSSGDTRPQIIEIQRRVRFALRKVAKTSKLNTLRVKSLFHSIELELS